MESAQERGTKSFHFGVSRMPPVACSHEKLQCEPLAGLRSRKTLNVNAR